MASKSFGNWVYEKLLGSGGFGQVELWKEKYTNKRLAIKVCMLANSQITPRQRERWIQEIEIMEYLKHPNIIKSVLLPTEIIFSSAVLCMEFCNRGDLRKILKKPENACGLTQYEALSVIKDISSALQYLHFKHITHRDLKPENIVLHEQNGMVIYKLIDLGYAKELSNATATNSLVGTFSYVAPEILQSKRYTCSVDYWSLGILFFEILTGYKPFTENSCTWFSNLEKKKYKDVCAIDIGGQIKFYDHIIYLNDLSRSILKQITEWFQIVLQVNPKKRGKRPDSEEVVVFPLLKEIVPFKIIYIVSVSLYRIDQYNMNNKHVTINELQQWIEKETCTPISKQIIVNATGNVITGNINIDRLPVEKKSDLTLYVYNIDCLEINNDINWDFPKILDLMVTDSTKISNPFLLRQCYTSLIYIMRYEVTLFKQYVFGLGAKLDLVEEKINILNTKIEKNLPNAELLLNKIKSHLESNNNIIVDPNALNKLCEKTMKLNQTVLNLKLDLQTIQDSREEIKQFFNNEELLSDLNNFSAMYEHLLNMFETFEKDKKRDSCYITEQVNKLIEIFFQFEEQKETQLKNHDTLVRKLFNLDKKLHDHLKIIDSCFELNHIYDNSLAELINKKEECITIIEKIIPTCDSNEVNSNIILTDDSVVRDNIVLRALLDKVLQNFQEQLAKNLSIYQYP